MKAAFTLIGAALLAGAATAHAHDTWFELRAGPPGKSGDKLLALGTGNQFPKQETGVGAEYLTASGCTAADALKPLRPLGNDEVSLLLRAPAGASSCWVQLQAFDVTVADDVVPLYLKEILASPEIRATWAAMQARGRPWRERYVKHARILLGTATSAAAPEQPLGMDLRLERSGDASEAALRAGQTVTAQVLRDGQPLANQALELRSNLSPLGIWRRSDAQGRVTLTLPLAGRWVLRGVDLRVSATNPDEWDSRFVTLTFEVLPKAQN